MQRGSTRWRPDTCGCVVVYDWTARGDEVLIHRPRFEVTCIRHAIFVDPVRRFDALRVSNGSALR